MRQVIAGFPPRFACGLILLPLKPLLSQARNASELQNLNYPLIPTGLVWQRYRGSVNIFTWA